MENIKRFRFIMKNDAKKIVQSSSQSFEHVHGYTFSKNASKFERFLEALKKRQVNKRQVNKRQA